MWTELDLCVTDYGTVAACVNMTNEPYPSTNYENFPEQLDDY